MKAFPVPASLEVDAYQLAMDRMIPPGMEDFQLSQLIQRKPLVRGDGEDQRLISAGTLPFVLLELERLGQRVFSEGDVDTTDAFLSDFHAMTTEPFCTAYPWAKEVFERVAREFGGKFPICVMALPDGQAHYVGEPSVQVWSDVPGMGELVGWIESSLLPYSFASSIVASRGRKRKERMVEIFRRAYPSKSLDEIRMIVEYRFHDFGRRGGAASQITGIAHLINFLGTDTMDAAFAATHFLNGGEKFGASSIAAAAHRTITPWAVEDDAYRRMLEKFGHGLVSVVADSYGYSQGIRKIAKLGYEIVRVKGGFLVGRPDSGDPVECVIEGMDVFAETFGTSETESGLKLINGAGIIQGDGIDDSLLFDRIYPAVFEAGYCPLNLAIGMGENNHAGVRSEIETGYKTALVGTADGGYRPSMKSSSSRFKMSVPGPVSIDCSKTEAGRVSPITIDQLKAGEVGDYQVVYDGRPNPLPVVRSSFAETRDLAWTTWDRLVQVPGDTFDPRIREMQAEYVERYTGQPLES